MPLQVASCCSIAISPCPSLHYKSGNLLTDHLADVQGGSRLSQALINPDGDRMRPAQHATRDPFYLLERRHGLMDIFERGAIISVDRLRVKAPGLKAASASVRMKLACYKVEVTIGDPSGRSMTATAPGLPPTARDGEPIGETKFVDGLTPHYETAQGFD